MGDLVEVVDLHLFLEEEVEVEEVLLVVEEVEGRQVAAAVVVLLVVVGVLRDQIQLRRMPRWLRAFARKLVIIGRMLLRNIQVGCA